MEAQDGMRFKRKGIAWMSPDECLAYPMRTGFPSAPFRYWKPVVADEASRKELEALQ